MEVEGTVEAIEPKEKGGAKVTLRTDEGESRTLHIASNYEGPSPQEGERGKAEFREWTPPNGKYAMKMVDGWESLGTAAVPEVSPNGSTPTPTKFSDSSRGGLLSNPERALEYAKEQALHLIDIGLIKDLNELKTAYTSAADWGLDWLKQNA